MSQAIASAFVDIAPETPSAATPVALRRVQRIGYAVLGMQLAGFLAWSTLLHHRFVLSLDYSQYHQAWFLIAHGNLDPYDTPHGFFFWQDHCDLLVWPTAWLDWVWPHDMWLLWLQDLGVVGAEAVVFTWLCEIVQRHLPGDRGTGVAWLAAAGLVLLVANPWTWAAVSFDFHIETVAIPFAALLARDLANERRRAWVWVPVLLAGGDVACTYVCGIGLGAALAGRRWRWRGLTVACLGVGAAIVITLVHGNLGSGRGLAGFDYLAASGPVRSPVSLSALVMGIATHPLRLLGALWAKRSAMWSNVAPAGLLGVCFVPLVPIIAVVLLADNLFPGVIFAFPGFQSIPLYVLVPPGTVAVLAWLARRYRRTATILTGLVVMQALAWTAVWAPAIPGMWLRVPASTAATLAEISARIPASAEVVASSGVFGRFADHAQAYLLAGSASGRVPVDTDTWFVVTPVAGVESQSTASAMALIAELIGPLHATLVTHANGVWALRLRPPPGMHTLTLPGDSGSFPPLPAWTAAGEAGRAVMTGPVAGWHVTSTGGRGYVADGLAWQAPPGRYQVQVKMSTTGPVDVEVWNDTNYQHDTLLARQDLVPTDGTQTVALAVDARTAYQVPLYSGWGLFHAEFWSAPPGQRLEVRIWSPGGSVVNVYSAELVAASGHLE